jgi:hypothetical protein
MIEMIPIASLRWKLGRGFQLPMAREVKIRRVRKIWPAASSTTNE